MGGWLRPAIVSALVVMFMVVFWQTTSAAFITFDDNDTVYKNESVLRGLTGPSIRWALTSFDHANWMPVTRISHLLDVELFGLDAGRHHRTNVVIHAVAVILLFLALEALTASIWCSAFVAALFAIHPLHVESVAWVTERKDVLSGAFAMLTILLWTRWVRRPSTGRYILVAVSFALGLMAKPMLVTLPFVLLLLDFWPLRRLRRETLAARFVEKIPLFVLSAVSSIVTFVAQRSGGAVEVLETLPLALRFANACRSVVLYLGKIVWPVDLAVFYPYDHTIPAVETFIELALLVAITFAIWKMAKRLPALTTGWLWFLGSLVPVIGLVQVGSQAMADRYMYIPGIGVYMIVAWGAMHVFDRLVVPAGVRAALAAAILVILSVVAFRQTALWKDSESLFTHTIAVTRPNALAHSNLGMALVEQERHADAVGHFEEAIRIRPGYVLARINLANAYARLGRVEDAIVQYREAVKIDSSQPDVHNNLGVALAMSRKLDDAEVSFRAALKADPSFVPAIVNLGRVAAARGNVEEARRQHNRALEIEPGNREANAELERLR